MQLTIPTTDEIRAVVRDELSAYFSLHQFQPNTETDEIGGIDLAVEITGKAKPTIYGLVHKRLIPHSKRGKRLYFSRKNLTEWIISGQRKTQSEIALDAEKFSSNNLKNKTNVTLR